MELFWTMKALNIQIIFSDYQSNQELAESLDSNYKCLINPCPAE